MNKTIDRLVRAVSLGDGPLRDVEYDAATTTWYTAVVIDDDTNPDGTGFELEFQLLPAEEGVSAEYLVVGWVVVPPDELKDGAAADVKLLQALNEANAEAGAKFRLQAGGGDTSLVCEVDLPTDGLTTPALQAAVERSRDVVAAYFDELARLARG
jgi:hypothetical protein